MENNTIDEENLKNKKPDENQEGSAEATEKIEGVTEPVEKEVLKAIGAPNRRRQVLDVLQEKLGKEYVVRAYEVRGYPKISIDEPKEILKKKYGAQILRDTAENIKRDTARYAGKTDDEILDIYFDEVALPQVEITFPGGDKANVMMRHYKEFSAQAYQGSFTLEELENETENFAHYIKTGVLLNTGKMKRNEIFNDPDFNPDDYTA